MIDPAISQLFEEHLPVKRAKRSRSKLLPPDMYTSIPLAYRDGQAVLAGILNGLEALSAEEQDLAYVEWDTQATRDTLARMFNDLYSTRAFQTTASTTTAYQWQQGQWQRQAVQAQQASVMRYYNGQQAVVWNNQQALLGGAGVSGNQPITGNEVSTVYALPPEPENFKSGGIVPTDARQKAKSALAEWSKNTYDKVMGKKK